MPSSHRHYAEWTPDRFRPWAGKIGPNTEGLISAVLLAGDAARPFLGLSLPSHRQDLHRQQIPFAADHLGGMPLLDVVARIAAAPSSGLSYIGA
jgi:hypothetical protein